MMAELVSATQVQRLMGNVGAISPQADVAVCGLAGLGHYFLSAQVAYDYVQSASAPRKSIEHCNQNDMHSPRVGLVREY